MDQRERSGDFEEALRAALDGRQAAMWTALPGIIQSFDPTHMTAVVQTAIKAKQRSPDDSVALVTLPLCLDCPVQFPSGGGASLTFPVTQGDECLVVFASRSIDGWWQSSGVQAPVEARMHDLSDGFVLLGFRSVPRVIPSISTASTQLRSDDGATVIDLNPTAKTVTITAPNGCTINVAGGTATVNAATANILAGAVNLGGMGGQPVARIGDTVSGGVITSGSSKVRAA